MRTCAESAVCLAGLSGERPVWRGASRTGGWAPQFPQFDLLGLELRRFKGGFGELDFCHDDSSGWPGSRSHISVMEGVCRIRFQQSSAYDGRL